MIETWRWFGEHDPISLADIRQTGAAGIVTALHDIPYGEVWPQEAIAARRAQIEAAQMRWEVVESLPLHDSIKRGEAVPEIFANYRQSMANLAAEGVRTICYNFMPLLDWTRTTLDAPVASGGTCLRFSALHMVAFEVHMVGRKEAADEYDPATCAAAAQWFDASSEAERAELLRSIMSGLPGAYDRYDIKGLKAALASYAGLSGDDLRAAFKVFLDEVVPAAEDLGLRLCVHPDDPPRDILGLPRIVSNRDDIAWILSAVDSPSNGLTLCAGSLGANPINDVPEIAREFGARIPFAHLRNVRKDPDGSFEEAAHLEGDTDMVALVAALLEVEHQTGRAIPFRPDHGHALLSDEDLGTHPGYPLIGRLRGLAELRGVVAALSHG